MTSEIAIINPEYKEDLIKQISDKINITVKAGEELHAKIDHKTNWDTHVVVAIPVEIPNHMVVKTTDMIEYSRRSDKESEDSTQL